MIISIGAIDTVQNRRVFRAARELSASAIAYYLTEFAAGAAEQEGVLEGDAYSYTYLTKGDTKFFVQATKDALHAEVAALLRHVAQGSESDTFDILFSIDCVLHSLDGVAVDMHAAKSMESQEEAIYNMMMENKSMEMLQREKTRKRVEYDARAGVAEAPVVQKQPPRIERSERPVLVIVREKLKIAIDAENYIKENHCSGEMNMVIYDPRFQSVQLKARSMRGAVKPSPYLDKQALKKGILCFESARGCNKSIPLLKWAGKVAKLPLTVEFWNDEEDGKYVSIVSCSANQDLDGVEFRFNKDDLAELQLGEGAAEEDGCVVWRMGALKKGESKTTELRFSGSDSKSIFPIDVAFKGSSVETPLGIEQATVDGEPTDAYEVRTVLEVEKFRILSD
ncbi:hypothetical protein PAPHI01_1821 [Pancytospora philotis]|nr:hypothetical protein PAPHI01_1821 [Pancytospora philotis]